MVYLPAYRGNRRRGKTCRFWPLFFSMYRAESLPMADWLGREEVLRDGLAPEAEGFSRRWASRFMKFPDRVSNRIFRREKRERPGNRAAEAAPQN